MTRLEKTDLSTPQKTILASSALAAIGHYGASTKLSKEFEVSRPTVNASADVAAMVLESHFDRDPNQSGGVWVWVDDAQLKRTMVAMRVTGPTSIRTIEDLLPIVYPGISTSYGTIQKILIEAEGRATQLNKVVDLSKLHGAALDEMFSQGDPVLAGVDLDSGFLFLLSHEESRKGEDWGRLLNSCKEQGLDLKIVVKDAARGIAAGVRAVFPEAEQRDDCFHALREMSKVHGPLEKQAWAAIKLEIEAKEQGLPDYERKRQKCEKAMIMHDSFEQAMRDVQEAMEFIDVERNRIRTAEGMQRGIETAAKNMMSLPNDGCKKVGRYIMNRAPGLSLYMNELNQALHSLSERFGRPSILLAAKTWRLFQDLTNNKRPWSRSSDGRRFYEFFHALDVDSEGKRELILTEVHKVLDRRFRASSAIEGFNAALRPHLYVHKGVSQGFLELFRAYFNLKIRRWGRHKKTSAYAKLTGIAVDDWLTFLGYPRSAGAH